MIPAALVAVALFVGAGVISLSGDDETPDVLTLRAGGAPFSLAAGDEALWVGNAGDGTVSRYRLRDGSPVGDPISVPSRPGGIAVGREVWVGSIEGSVVVRLTPGDSTGRPVPVEVGRDPAAIVLENDDAWVAALNEGTISRISRSGEIVATIDELAFPSALAFVGDDLWAADVTEGTVSRIDSGSATIEETIEVGAGPTALASFESELWVALFREEALAAVDAGGEVEVVALGSAPSGLATGAGYVWATLAEEDSLVRVDPDTLEVSERVEVGDNPQGVVVAGGAVWVANQGDNTVTRLALPDGQ